MIIGLQIKAVMLAQLDDNSAFPFKSSHKVTTL